MVGGSNRYPKPSNTTHKKEKGKKKKVRYGASDLARIHFPQRGAA